MGPKKKILIVEDNPTQQMLLFDAIAKAGFLVRKASDGDEGYQQAMSSQPDLIIADKMMPGTTGLMMMNRLREQNEWGRNVPVLFFSNVGTANAEETALLDIIKPIGYLPKGETSLETIVTKIKEVFEVAKHKEP